MSQYRVKVPTFFLGLLMLIALINLVGNLRLRAKVARLPGTPVNIQSAEAFEVQAANLSDVTALRALATQEHQRVLAADHMVGAMIDLLKVINRSLLIQGGGMLALAILYFLFEYRMPPR